MDAISRAVKVLGGQKALADAIGVSPQAVNQWVRQKRPVPPLRCRPIQIATDNQVTAEELRPDVFEPPAGGSRAVLSVERGEQRQAL